MSMIECTPLPATDASRATTYTTAIPIAGSRLGDSRFFAVVVGNPIPRTARGARSIAGIGTTIENIANEHAADGAAHAHEWLTACVQHLRKRLDPALMTGVSACIGIAAPHGDRITVSLACSGALGALVLQRSASGTPRAMPIAEPQTTVTGLAFAHAVEGTIGAQDAVVIGPAPLFEPQRTEQLTRAFREHAVPDALDALRTLDGFPAGMVIASASARRAPRSQSSMHAFLATAASTERFLTPSLGPVLRAYGTDLRSSLASLIASCTHRRRTRTRAAARPRALPFLLEVIRVAFRTIAVGIRSIAVVLADGARLIGIALIHVARAVRRVRNVATSYKLPATSSTNPEDGRFNLRASRFAPITLRPRRLIATSTALIARSRSWYRSLPPQSRRLFLLTITFAALFLVSTGALWRRRAADTDVASYNATIAKIEELRSVAEARLLFNDRAAARSALAEATERLATLPRTSHARRERAALIASELSASFDRARLITRVPKPLVVAAVGEKIPFPAIGGIILLEHDLIAVADDGRRIARINPRTGAVATLDLQGTHAVRAPFRTIALDERSVLMVDADAHAAIVDARDGTVQIATIEQPPVAVRDAAMYQQRLYLLHGDGAITRHTRTAGGFARGTQWLEPARALAGARTMTVTGTIIVGAEDGTIATYAAGRRKETSAFSDIDPPFRAAPRIIADASGDTISLGDPGEGRIIAVAANGGLIGQVQSDAFRGLSDLALDASSQSLYILRGNEISVIIPPKAPRP